MKEEDERGRRRLKKKQKRKKQKGQGRDVPLSSSMSRVNEWWCEYLVHVLSLL